MTVNKVWNLKEEKRDEEKPQMIKNERKIHVVRQIET